MPQTRWFVELVLSDIEEGEDEVTLKEFHDDEQSARSLFLLLAEQKLQVPIKLYRQERYNLLGWKAAELIEETLAALSPPDYKGL